MSSTSKILVQASVVSLVLLLASQVYAQIPQIPAQQPANESLAEGDAVVKIDSRGDFNIKVSVKFDAAADDYPVGNLRLKVDMSDSLKGVFEASHIQHLSTTGKHTATIWISGRCIVESEGEDANVDGAQFWVMIADNTRDNQGTPDIVSFLIIDKTGKRIAYGTGPVADGDIEVKDTPN